MISIGYNKWKYGKLVWTRRFISGWWFQATPLKNDGVNVSWNDDISNVMEINMFQTTNQIWVYPYDINRL